MNIQMDIGQWPSSIIDISLQLARLPAWERLVRHPLLASLLASWQLIELIASAVNFPSCWPHTFIAPQKSPTNSLQYLPAEISTANSQFYSYSESQDKCYSPEKPRMTNRKVLRGKQGDHISLPSDRKVIQLRPLTCELRHWNALMWTFDWSTFAFFNFGNTERELTTACPTKGPVREVCKLPLITAMDWPSCPHWRVDLIYFPNSFLALLDIFWN